MSTVCHAAQIVFSVINEPGDDEWTQNMQLHQAEHGDGGDHQPAHDGVRPVHHPAPVLCLPSPHHIYTQHIQYSINRTEYGVCILQCQ